MRLIPIRVFALASLALLTACAGDRLTVPQLKPDVAPVVRLDGSLSGVPVNEPLRVFIDGSLVEGNALQAVDPAQIATIEVRRKTETNPFNEIYITLRQPR
ncbi:MAG TPA: hypothetical protein VF665_16720 [Longimicrobium sp.]|jgi:hypothetical protein|uniref:hypothetical protein n=1 Tax=Longimicrobium sp. TaxID=2029185 RepID=UPI002ED78571